MKAYWFISYYKTLYCCIQPSRLAKILLDIDS